MTFEKRLNEALGGETSGSTTVSLPYELDIDETDVKIDYVVSPGEERTFDYPGSPPTIEIQDTTIEGGKPEPEGFEEWLASKDLEEQLWQDAEGQAESGYWQHMYTKYPRL